MIDMEQYGYRETDPPGALLPGRITAVYKERYQLICPHGTLGGRLKSSAYYGKAKDTEKAAIDFPTVGDFVWVKPVDSENCQIVKTLPRRSQFIRRDPYAGEQVVAANFDYVFILSSLDRDFNVNRIERYCILARQAGISHSVVPVVILSKADLAEDSTTQTAAVMSVVGDVDIIPISVLSGLGLERVNAYLTAGRTVVFLGMSGVGKSSLLNALIGYDVMTVNTLHREGRGRHTTTHRELFTLSSGAMIIDTPGMRMIGLFDSPEGISESFPAIDALLGKCRFLDCHHGNEPGCAIKAALRSGELSEELWEKYIIYQREAQYADSRASILQRKLDRQKIREAYSKRKSGGAYLERK